jgi:HPt (histidine-containing phosphotransfer) domain-containing protein
VRELITLYLQKTTGEMEGLEKAVGLRNFEEIRQIAHMCAGSSGTCGMGPFSKILRALEEAAEEKDAQQCDQSLENARSEYARVIIELRKAAE